MAASVTITICVSPELHTKLKGVAEEKEWTISHVARRIVSDYFMNEGKK